MSSHLFIGAISFFDASIVDCELQSVVATNAFQPAGVRMRYFESMPFGCSQSSKLQKINSDNIRENIRFTRDISRLVVYSKRSSLTATVLDPLSQQVICPFFTAKSHCVQTVISQDDFDEAQLISFLESVANLKSFFYGFVCIGDFYYVNSLLSFICINKPGSWKVPSNDSFENMQELSFYHDRIDLLASFIHRGEWALVLSERHIKSFSQIVAHDATSYSRQRWGKSMFVKLDMSIWDVTSSHLSEFNRLLSPLRLPHAPVPNYE